MRTLIAVYRATWREGLPMLGLLPMLWIYALLLESLT
jgi:hypothetical protein